MIVTLGDLLLDVIVRLSQPLAEGADADAVTRFGAGGQAANVAAWVAELGGEARFVGKTADDEAGRTARAALAGYGVEVLGPVVEGRTGTIVSLVDPGGERTMASDRGVSPELRADELDLAWFEDQDLHLPAYSLVREPIATAARAAASVAEMVVVDLSSWSVIRDYGTERFRALLEEIDPDYVFANEDEARILEGPWDGRWIVKRGPRGARFGDEERRARRTSVVDSTGAGDAFAAGWWVGGADLALRAAARCVAQLGSMP